MSTHQEANTEDSDSVKGSTESGDTEYIFWKDWMFWTLTAISVMMQLIMIVHVSVKHSEVCRENDTSAIRLSSADTLKFASQECSSKDIIDVENKRKWTDLIETTWEKRKETLLADLHQKLEESMTENMKIQERKNQNKLGECNGMKDSLKKIQNQLDGTGEQIKTLDNKVAKAMEKVEEANKQMKILENDMTETKDKVEETNKQMKTLENDMTDTKKKVEETNKQMKTLENNITDIEEKFKGMNKEIKTLEKNMTENKEKVEETNKQMKILKNDINENKENVEEMNKQINKLENNMTKIEGNVEGANRQLETLKNFVTETDEKVEETKKQIKTLANDMTKTGGKVKGLETNIETLQNDLFKTKEKLDGKDEEMKKNINNYIACFLLAEVIHIIFGIYIYALLKLTAIYKTTGPRHGIDVHRLSYDTISENLKVKGLKKGLLIVSFHPSSQQFHHNALNAVSEFMKTSPVKVLIQNSSELANVEPHKLVIIFVDFNERNIVLEYDDTEVGDLRKQTTKMFLSLKCDVFVVYCKDNGSQDLPPNNLYNPRLLSIDRHPVLSELKRNNRVLSIYDKFHPHQVELLKKCCQ